jgi:hypothetical protein
MPQPSTPTTTPTVRWGPLGRPHAKLTRRDGHLLLTLQAPPAGIHVQVRLLGYKQRPKHLTVLRTLTSSSTTLTLTTATVQVALRYIDPYDITRASPWTTLKAPRAGEPRRRP